METSWRDQERWSVDQNGVTKQDVMETEIEMLGVARNTLGRQLD